MAKKDVKSNLLDHSEAKVRLLGEYLKRYLNIIANDKYTERIKIYDLFCGEGKYENEGEGSPLVILRAVKEIHFTNVARLNKIPPIDCHFNDIASEKVQKVVQAVKEKKLYYPEYGEVKFTSFDYQTEVKKLAELFQNLKNQKAFVFIDPYGYKHINAKDIKNLLSKNNAEVLLFLPTQFMYRFDTNGTPEALVDFIEELVPYKDWSETDSVWKFIEQLKEAFRNYMGNKFVDTFTIKKDSNTVFCLFFFSSHIKGFEKMLESKWEIDTTEGKGWEYGQSGSLFEAIKTNPLEEKLELLLKDGSKYNGEIYEFTIRSGFLPKHTNEVFSSWQGKEKNKLDVIAKNGEKARKGAFYIGYNHYKNDREKVSFKLK